MTERDFASQAAWLLAALDRERRQRRNGAARASSQVPGLAARLRGAAWRVARRVRAACTARRRAPSAFLGCTVVIPTWRRNPFLAEAVESCLAQSVGRDAVQVLVCANGADLGWRDELAERYAGERAVRVLHCRRADPNAARRLGVEAAEKPLLTFLDDDDTLSRGFLERLGGFFANPAVNIAIGRVECFDVSGHRKCGRNVLADTLRRNGTAATGHYRELSPLLSTFCFKLYRTAFFQSAFRIRDSEFPFGEDVLFWAENYPAIRGKVRCDDVHSPEFYARRLVAGSRSCPGEADAAAMARVHLGMLDCLAELALDSGNTLEHRCFAVSKLQARTSAFFRWVAGLPASGAEVALEAARRSGNPFLDVWGGASGVAGGANSGRHG